MEGQLGEGVSARRRAQHVEVDGVRTPVQAGSVAHVPPHVPHRFVDVDEQLQVVVVFAPPGPD